MKKLLVATKNKGKIREFTQMLKNDFAIVTLDEFPYMEEPEENGTTFMENARLKASYYSKKTQVYCIADDSGLEVDALGGAPGVMSARYAGEHGLDKENNKLLLKNMEKETNRKCRFFCALALSDSTGKIVLDATGTCEGELLYEEKGEGGFGYDPLFFSLDLKKALAEASSDEKNAVSHRSHALKKLTAQIGENKCL